MALNPRYAAFLKKHPGRSDLDHSLVTQHHSRPHKVVEHAGRKVLVADADSWANAGVGDQETLYAHSKQPLLPTGIASPPSSINLRKRPAASDALPTEDVRRPDSPVKFSRTAHARFASLASEVRPVHEQLAAFSLSNQLGRPSQSQWVNDSSPDSSRVSSKGGFLSSAQSLQQHVSQVKPILGLDGHVVRVDPEVLTLAQLRLQEMVVKQNSPLRNFTAGPGSDAIDDEEEFDLQVNESLESQPQSRPLTDEQLTSEVKAIYAGLVIIEAKCVNIVNEQTAALAQGRIGQLDAAQWHAMISLHRSLLYEHHDFLMASQHPSATEALRRLPMKYSMPARMWRVGIHNFLELLRRHLPHSLEFMLLFIYQAYQTISLLYETIPAFQDTWIECLGDLSRYRMAIEEEDQSDREAWTGVARYWYGKASDKNPTVGRLYHHLAVLARSQALHQLSLYCRSLSAVQIFPSARESIMTLFDPVLARSTSAGSRPLSVESWFIRCHGLIFSNAPVDVTNSSINAFIAQLGDHILRLESKFRLQSACMAITNITSLLGYGASASPLRDAFLPNEQGPPPPLMNSNQLGVLSSRILNPRSSPAWTLTLLTLRMALSKPRNEDVLPLIHVMLVFILRLTRIPYGSDSITSELPWPAIANYLNTLQRTEATPRILRSPGFPTPENGDRQLLPEDFFIRGMVWSQDYFPSSWFDDVPADDERLMESTSAGACRIDRVLWLGSQIASCKGWLEYDVKTTRFHVNNEFAHHWQAGQPRGDTVPQQSDTIMSRTRTKP